MYTNTLIKFKEFSLEELKFIFQDIRRIIPKHSYKDYYEDLKDIGYSLKEITEIYLKLNKSEKSFKRKLKFAKTFSDFNENEKALIIGYLQELKLISDEEEFLYPYKNIVFKSIKNNYPIKIWGKTQRKVFENKEDLFKWLKNFPPSQIGYVDKYNIFYPGITPELKQRIENFYNSFTKSLIKIEWDQIYFIVF